jgi:hypothetical protein
MNRELAQKVRDFIGYPPKSVLFSMIEKEFPEHTTKELEEIMDFLWDKGLVQVWGSNWIAGRKPQVQLKLSMDDIDWLQGTGRYAQG